MDFAKRMELAISNTFFVKKPAHRVTYNSGGRNLQVDYIMVRRCRIKEVVDTKVIVGESIAKTTQNSSQEEVDGRDEGRYGEGWSCGGRRGGLGKVEETCTLWRPQIGKSPKEEEEED